MAQDVFLSYSTKDKSAAEAVCAALEREKISVWMAPRDIQPGSSYAASIIEAIDSARVMVLVFSHAANDSLDVEREVQRASAKQLRVIPFRIEDVDPKASLAYFLPSTQYLDAFTPPLQEHYKTLAKVVRQIASLTSPPGPGPAGPPPSPALGPGSAKSELARPPSPPIQPRTNWPLIIPVVAVALAVIGVAGWVAWHYPSSFSDYKALTEAEKKAVDSGDSRQLQLVTLQIRKAGESGDPRIQALLAKAEDDYKEMTKAADGEAAPPAPPADLAWCYQEQQKPKVYFVACHKQQAACAKVRGINNPVPGTDCQPVDLSKVSWNPSRGGILGSQYQTSDTQFPKPFPQIDIRNPAFGIVFGADGDPKAAMDEANKAKKAPMSARPVLYRKKGLWLSVVKFASQADAAAQLPNFKPITYDHNPQIVDLSSWCPNPRLISAEAADMAEQWDCES